MHRCNFQMIYYAFVGFTNYEMHAVRLFRVALALSKPVLMGFV